MKVHESLDSWFFCWLFFILLVCSVSNLFRLNWSDFSIRTLTHFGVCLYSVFNELSLSSQVTTSIYYHVIDSLSNIFYNFFNVFFFRSDVLYRTSVNIAYCHPLCQCFFKNYFWNIVFIRTTEMILYRFVIKVNTYLLNLKKAADYSAASASPFVFMLFSFMLFLP